MEKPQESDSEISHETWANTLQNLFSSLVDFRYFKIDFLHACSINSLN